MKLVLLLVLLTPSLLHAQFRERIDVIAVEIPIEVRDREGKTPRDLTKDDFEVFEDGARQEVIDLVYPPPRVDAKTIAEVPSVPEQPREKAKPWQIVVFVQQSVSTTPGLREGFKGLLEQTETLAALGNVEIITDHPSVRRILAPTRDVETLRKTFANLQQTMSGQEQLMRIRRALSVQLAAMEFQNTRPETRRSVFMSFAHEEGILVRNRQETMLAWMSAYGPPSDTRRLLLFLTDGYALEPVRFYGYLPAMTSAERFDLSKMSSAPRQSQLARTLGAQGWTVYSVATGTLQNLRDKEMMEVTLIEVDVFAPSGEKFGPMQMLAAETGGKITTDIRRIERDVQTFADRLTLTYRARRERDGTLRRLVIRSRRPGIRVTHQQSVISETPERIAMTRATAIALDVGERGELPVACRIHPGSKRGEESLIIRLDLASFGEARASLASATARVAVGAAADKRLPFESVQLFTNLDFATRAGYELTIPLRKRGNARVAVVVEELSTGAWGGATCELAPDPSGG